MEVCHQCPHGCEVYKDSLCPCCYSSVMGATVAFNTECMFAKKYWAKREELKEKLDGIIRTETTTLHANGSEAD